MPWTSQPRLRGIERDLHDGTQAQLVALAMKLGLAKEKLNTASPADLSRVTQLVDDAHRGGAGLAPRGGLGGCPTECAPWTAA